MAILIQVLIHENSGVDISRSRWYCMRKPVLMYVYTSVNVVGMQVLTYAITGFDVWECRC